MIKYFIIFQTEIKFSKTQELATILGRAEINSFSFSVCLFARQNFGFYFELYFARAAVNAGRSEAEEPPG